MASGALLVSRSEPRDVSRYENPFANACNARPRARHATSHNDTCHEQPPSRSLRATPPWLSSSPMMSHPPARLSLSFHRHTLLALSAVDAAAPTLDAESDLTRALLAPLATDPRSVATRTSSALSISSLTPWRLTLFPIPAALLPHVPARISPLCTGTH